MLLHKTALAHSALHAGSRAGLSLAERRVLIVVDGKRTLDEVVALLGPDILPLLDRLDFSAGVRNWGYPFRFGLFTVTDRDLDTIAAATGAVLC